jgi:hypothetical protein
MVCAKEIPSGAIPVSGPGPCFVNSSSIKGEVQGNGKVQKLAGGFSLQTGWPVSPG